LAGNISAAIIPGTQYVYFSVSIQRSSKSPLLFGHASIVTDRHVAIQHDLFQNFGRPSLQLLDRFQHDLLGRRVEAWVRWRMRVTHHAVLTADRKHIRVQDISGMNVGRHQGGRGGEQCRRRSPCARAHGVGAAVLREAEWSTP
jgi:hypothetical protein